MPGVVSPIRSPINEIYRTSNETNANVPTTAAIHSLERDALKRIGQMEQESDLIYLDRRASEERHAAVSSANREVRNRHLELASAYEFRVHLLREQTILQAARAQAAEKVPARKRTQRIRTTLTPEPQVMIIGARNYDRKSR